MITSLMISGCQVAFFRPHRPHGNRTYCWVKRTSALRLARCLNRTQHPHSIQMGTSLNGFATFIEFDKETV